MKIQFTKKINNINKIYRIKYKNKKETVIRDILRINMIQIIVIRANKTDKCFFPLLKESLIEQ